MQKKIQAQTLEKGGENVNCHYNLNPLNYASGNMYVLKTLDWAAFSRGVPFYTLSSSGFMNYKRKFLF